MLVLIGICSSPLLALPSDYEQEATPLVSPQELNLIYGSLPQKKGDNFQVLGKHDYKTETGLPKHFLLHQHNGGKTEKYLIVRLDVSGVTVIDESYDNPFRRGTVPQFKKELPLTVACALQSQCFGLHLLGH